MLAAVVVVVDATAVLCSTKEKVCSCRETMTMPMTIVGLRLHSRDFFAVLKGAQQQHYYCSRSRRE